MNFPRHLVLAALLAWVGPSRAHALEAPSEFTLDLPFGTAQATPAWLGHPVTPAGTFATLDLPITPPDGAASLLVTVFYQEQAGGFLRISWQGATVPPTDPDELPGPGEAAMSSVLCDNFYEGIGMANQRSLLIAADTLRQAGSLCFQAGGSTLGISRIKLEWLQSSTGLSSPAITDILVTPASGKTQLASDLAGTPPAASDPAWHDRVVDVPLTDVPLRIEQGVDFSVQMDGLPVLARLALKESGLPWGQHLVVWINNQRAGLLVPAMPDLGDGGYPAEASAPYVGWREGTLFVPVSDFSAGTNTVQVSAEPDVTPASGTDSNAAPVPLAVKDVVLQLAYPPSFSAPAVAGSGVGAAGAGSTLAGNFVPAANASASTPLSP